jgi:hypothetical protein
MCEALRTVQWSCEIREVRYGGEKNAGKRTSSGCVSVTYPAVRTGAKNS